MIWLTYTDATSALLSLGSTVVANTEVGVGKVLDMKTLVLRSKDCQTDTLIATLELFLQ